MNLSNLDVSLKGIENKGQRMETFLGEVARAFPKCTGESWAINYHLDSDTELESDDD